MVQIASATGTYGQDPIHRPVAWSHHAQRWARQLCALGAAQDATHGYNLTPLSRAVVRIPLADREALEGAGIAGAKALYICANDSTDSVASLSTVVAAALARGRKSSDTLRVYAQIADAKLTLPLQARRIGLSLETDALLLDFFNVDELAARHLLGQTDVAVDPDRAPHIVVAGLGDFGRAVVVEYARYWRRTRRAGGRG
jgi:hypothetical protein